jgi:hypothetical protein
MKIEIAKACIFILIGAYLFNRFSPEPKLPEVKVVQEQAAKCKAVVKKETKPDGTKTEEVVFESDVSQKQEVVIMPKADPYKIYLGAGTDLKAQVSVSKDNQLHELKTDGKNHVYYFNYKVAEIDF